MGTQRTLAEHCVLKQGGQRVVQVNRSSLPNLQAVNGRAPSMPGVPKTSHDLGRPAGPRGSWARLPRCSKSAQLCIPGRACSPSSSPAERRAAGPAAGLAAGPEPLPNLPPSKPTTGAAEFCSKVTSLVLRPASFTNTPPPMLAELLNSTTFCQSREGRGARSARGLRRRVQQAG